MLLKTIKMILGLWACLLIPVIVNGQIPNVTKVEPPNWWANHTINPVRLLVRGENLQGAKVMGGFRTGNIRVNDNGTYLFVDVTIPQNTKAGDYPLQLETANGKTTIPFSINKPPDATKNFQGITNDDVIYLIMPDRFANGDTSNDKPKDSPAISNDRNNPRAWHGGDFRGIINRLSYLKELGITAIWLTPWYDNPNTVNECDKPWCPNTNYHGYHAIDYYGVEDHFGTMKDLQELIDKAHLMGIKVIQDQVANHVGVQHVWAKNPPLKNWFHGTVDNFQKLTFKNDQFLSPYTPESERRLLTDGWFNELLPDMNQEEPEVARYQIQNALWWVGVTGIDGIRQDTIQYMSRTFIREWSLAIKKQYPKLWMVGEAWGDDAAHTAFFMGGHKGFDGIDTALPSVFDFPLCFAAKDVFAGKKPMKTLRDLLRYDALYPDPNRLTTIYDNHDMPRTASYEKMTLEGAMLNMAFILSVRGIPQLYYGNEIAMKGEGDPDNRRDFPGGWADDKRNAFTKEGRTADEQKMFEWTRDWLKLKRDSLALRTGKTTDLFYDDDVYIFERSQQLVDWVDIVIIAINKSDKEKNVSIGYNVPKRIALQDVTLKPIKSDREKIKIEEGKVTLLLSPKSAIVYGIRP